ncbi:uncharacterized protein [Leptinotarsa decemlineata]|uniref:uncharacterized protein n=1 Tax=Leptinotarsa decemlineata TaxID=7539 RepID=UPI003D309678
MTTQASLGAVNCTIQPLSSSQPSLTLEFIVLENISSNMPTFSIDPSSWNYIENINLADPHFFNPAQIDLLLGADVFQRILLDGRIRGDENLPTALNTSFGWILFGKVGEVQQKNVNSFLNIVEMARLENAIKKFWELEEIPNKPIISEEDKMCEDIFLKTTIRTDTGRFMVSLPFKETSNLKFENSREIALRRFFSLEKRLHRETDLCVEYSKIFSEYIESGYMEKIPDSELNAFPSYYIPHTCVFKPDSSTSKVRVVFDASTKCSNNFSLNDVLMKGPKLQKNISAILLNFRLHAIAFTSDISRMYLRILINPANRDFQRLFWRFTPQEPLIEYRLCTVTFGVVSSPWLALRTLAQLANDESLRFPLASRILLSDSIYVDDVIGGCNSLDEALEIQRQLIELCRKGGFHLKKWSNKETESTIKVLGLKWTPSLDTFSYTINAVEAKINKRNILSEIGRIFDPLGFLSPVTLCAKLIMKQLWMQANRISMIQENISPNCWRHVTSEDNPADCASRSLLPKDLVDHPLWWTGPPWLCKPESEWPLQKFKICIDDQEERKSTLIAFTEANFLEEILNRFSSLDKIKGILAYAKRFIYNLKNPLKKVVGHSFSEVELQEVLVVLVNFTQSSVFANEISQLKTNKPLPKYMRKLSAFIDEHGSLRVGGRLNNSLLNYDKKHPLLLPSSSRLTDLIIEHTHKMNLHPGLQTLHFLLLQNFWILSPRRTISKVLSKCFQCWRLKPRCLQPPMGDLPATRVSQVKPFSVIAVDFCGPFNIT